MFIIYTTFSLPILLFNINYKFRYKLAILLSKIVINLIWYVLGIKYELINEHLIPKDGKPMIAISNHQSFWENFFMQLIIPVHTWFMKKELFSIPFFGWGLRLMKTIPLDRANKFSVRKILIEGKDRLENNISLIIFPESTRIAVGKCVNFKPSAAKLAIENKAPILLMAHDAGKYWPKGLWFTKPGTIKFKIIEYIDPIYYEKHDARSLTNYMESKINEEKEK
jgi:1-acyl-sn-glycerol-3-phosphate acyltransferase